MITAIAFDWGGVFTEGTFDSRAVRNLASACRASVEQVSASYFPLMTQVEAGSMGLAEFHQEFVVRSGLVIEAQTFRETFLGSVRERAEMYGLVARIPAHYTVGMLSNNAPELCHAVRGDPRLRRIEHFVFSNEIGVRKPDLAAFAALSAALGVPPEQTVFIDDNTDNIDAALGLGFHALWLDTMPSFRVRWQAVLPEILL
jgi:putative hydrolase of the HAD superfamily